MRVLTAADGQTYERAAITQWLTTHDTSPLTGEQLEHKQLVPNLIVRGMCRKLVEAHPSLMQS